VVPSSWKSPVVVPADYATSLPTNQIVTVVSSPSIVIVSRENVPTYVPTAVVTSVPHSWLPPQVVSIPPTWHSPVVVPAALVTNVPSSKIITYPSSPSVVIIQTNDVPTSIPTQDISPVPNSIIPSPPVTTLPIEHVTTVYIHKTT
jgi:hypothetical protein